MVNVVIAGVPKNIKISKFIEFMEHNIFQEKIHVRVNYIRWYKRDTKKLSLNMKSNDARKAIRYLNGYEYVSRRNNYALSCWKESSADSNDSEEAIEPPSKKPRTLSPNDEPDELQDIDHRIELIRKQRILLEEESQLLLQKKRLEMIQNLGPNDFQKLSELEEMVEINQSITETKVEEKLRKPLDFQGPWQIIYKKMKSLIKAYVNIQDRPIFLDLLRSRVKNRLALVLKDKGILKANAIIALYRNIHPVESDISLVQEVLVKINQSIPINMTTKYNNGDDENEQDNTSDQVYQNVKYDYEDIEKIEQKHSQNEEMAFYEDINPDFGTNTNQETTVNKPETIKTELDFDKNQSTGKERNYEHISEINSNTSFAENRETELFKKEINKNDCKEGESNKISEEINMNKELVIDESDVFSDNTNKQIEPALNEVLDMDNDLDDWVEDEDDHQEIKADK